MHSDGGPPGNHEEPVFGCSRLASGVTTTSSGSGRAWLSASSALLVGMVALPIIAVAVLDASTLHVSLLVAFTAITTAVLAFPMASVVEFRRKRPVMVAADLAPSVSLRTI